MKRTRMMVLGVACSALALLALAGCGANGQGSEPAAEQVNTAAPGSVPTAAAPPVVTSGTGAVGEETPTEQVAATSTGVAALGTWTPGSPEEAVNNFYSWYLKQTQIGNPLVTQAYRTSPYLTDRLKKEIDNTLASAKPGIEGDPIICAQQPPAGFRISSPATINESTATVAMTTQYLGEPAPHQIRLTLRSVNGQWQIDTIGCPAATP